VQARAVSPGDIMQAPKARGPYVLELVFNSFVQLDPTGLQHGSTAVRRHGHGHARDEETKQVGPDTGQRRERAASVSWCAWHHVSCFKHGLVDNIYTWAWRGLSYHDGLFQQAKLFVVFALLCGLGKQLQQAFSDRRSSNSDYRSRKGAATTVAIREGAIEADLGERLPFALLSYPVPPARLPQFAVHTDTA
jgi:hypothetical protein